jgi:ATP/maltotriose-dependent transcriptional regulator MalT
MPDLPVPIIRSKLYPPPMATDTVRRERLLSLAQTAADVPLTLVSAPAGCGKSTLASQWLGLIGCRSAWLSLDPADSDLTQFLSKVLAACDWKIRGKDECLRRATGRSVARMAQPSTSDSSARHCSLE